MEKRNLTLKVSRKSRSGFTLVEVIVSMVILVIPMSAIGILLVGGQRGWDKTYSSAHKQIKADAQTVIGKTLRIAAVVAQKRRHLLRPS